MGKHFVSLKRECRSGVQTRDLRLPKQAALISAPGGRRPMEGQVSANITHLRRWAAIVKKLYRCFVFALVTPKGFDHMIISNN